MDEGTRRRRAETRPSNRPFHVPLLVAMTFLVLLTTVPRHEGRRLEEPVPTRGALPAAVSTCLGRQASCCIATSAISCDGHLEYCRHCAHSIIYDHLPSHWNLHSLTGDKHDVDTQRTWATCFEVGRSNLDTYDSCRIQV